MGASAQAPKQFTVSKVNILSGVVEPAAIPNLSSMRLNTFAVPRTKHAVPEQTVIRCLPRGLRLKAA